MESLKEPDINLLSSDTFCLEKYVRDLSHNCVGGPELRRLRKNIQSLLEETNSTLKKNVYQNYMQFIDSAKEIAHLESEMYQLSHLLSEQKALLTTLSGNSILGDDLMLIKKSENRDTEEKKQKEINQEKLASILEKVEGCKELFETSDRTYLYEGPLMELDPVNNNVISSVQAYLFSDGLMIATRTNRGLMKYVFEVMYELGNLAVVNVKDLENVKHAFKLLMFPDIRIFKCNSSLAKKEWLDNFDQAKKSKFTQDQKKRESVSEKSPSRSMSIDSHSLNPFEETDDDVGLTHPEWFLEAPEELDVCVAQRHFEDALALLERASDYAIQAPPDHIVTEVQRKVDQRHNHLTEVLMKELEVRAEKSLQGGLGACRRAVRLLIKLGQSSQACDLFLKLCTCMLKIQQKHIKKESSTLIYVKHFASVVFTNICHMTEEFLRNFQDTPSCYSAYIVWVNVQLSKFTSKFVKKVFTPQTSFSIIAECIVLIRQHCERLQIYGVDLWYQMNSVLQTYIVKTLNEVGERTIKSLQSKTSVETWKPTNLKSKNALAKFLLEYSEMGLELDTFVTGDVWLRVTLNNLEFAKIYLNFLNDCMKIRTREFLYAIDCFLYDVLNEQFKYHNLSLQEETEVKEFVSKNIEFLHMLCDVSQKKYQNSVGFSCEQLKQIKKEYSGGLSGSFSKNRNIKSKYSSEYL